MDICSIHRHWSLVLGTLVFTLCTCGAAGKQTVTVLDFESIGSEEHLGKAIS